METQRYFEVNTREYVTDTDYLVTRPASINHPKDHAVMFITKKYPEFRDVFLQVSQCLIFWPEEWEIPEKISRKNAVYRVPSSTEWSPQLAQTVFPVNAMVDITGFEEKKERALLAYQTEIREYPHPRSARYVRETDRACGLQWGMGPSEAFVILRNAM